MLEVPTGFAVRSIDDPGETDATVLLGAVAGYDLWEGASANGQRATSGVRSWIESTTA